MTDADGDVDADPKPVPGADPAPEPAGGAVSPAQRPESGRQRVFGREAAICGIGALALALVGAVTWFVTHTSQRQAQAGDLVPGDVSSTAPSRSVSVLEPWGRVDLTVSSPRRSLPHDVAYNAGNLRPPGDGRFVAVGWSATPTYEPLRVSYPPYPRTHLSLVAEGRSFPLDTPPMAGDPCLQPDCVGVDGDDSVWVAVPGSADHLQVAAEFDGVTQTVDVGSGARKAGRAAPLYASLAGSTLSPDCGPVQLQAGFRLSTYDGGTDTCHLTAYRSPYVSGRGWSPVGFEWVVVTARTNPPFSVTRTAHGGVPAFDLRTSDPGAAAPVTARLAGAVAGGPLVAATTDLTAASHAADGVSVFRVPAPTPTGTLTLSEAVPYVPSYSDTLPASARPMTVTFTWTVSA